VIEQLPPRTSGREQRRRERDARRRRRRVLWRALVALVALAAAFVAGLAVGRALEDTPQPGGGQTLVRTLDPLTLAPAGAGKSP
jgi:predicted metal-binding membrane protein